MTIALKIGNEDSQVKGFIYLDAVTAYTKTLGGKVTSFPVDSGVNISDHFISNNQKISFEGVVSDVDITGVSDLIEVDGDKPTNANPKPVTPELIGQQSVLQYLPSAVTQFFDKSQASVVTSSQSPTNIPTIEAMLEDLLRANYYNEADKKWRNKMTFTTLYEMDGTNFVNAKTDLVITDVSIQENVDSGDALYMSFSLEKIRLVTLDKTDMPKKAVKSVKKKVASKETQGKQDPASGVCTVGEKSTDSNAPTSSDPAVDSVIRLRQAASIAGGK